MHLHCGLIKPATSVYIVREQLISHQPVMRMLACSKDFPIRVVCILFHTRVFFKFKSSCTVAYFHGWFYHLATFLYQNYYKGGQVTKSIMKICYKLLYVIQGVKSTFDKVTSWPQLISRSHLPACMLLLIGLTLFYTQNVFV